MTLKRGTGLGTLLGIAVGALVRKKGRNTLTALGVAIGVFALTTIVALGEGMTALLEGTVSNNDNLSQIGLSPGFGNLISNEEIVIEGDMPPARRERLQRAARARQRPGNFMGQRATALLQDELDQIAKLEHVQSVTPVVVERYEIEVNGSNGGPTDIEKRVTTTLGFDVERKRLSDRLIAGKYISGPQAQEILLHEYLAYQWGFKSEASCAGLVGRKVKLNALRTSGTGALPSEALANAAQYLSGSKALTDDEKKELSRMAMKLAAEGMASAQGAQAVTREFTIAGVVREMEPGDPFNIIEDGNAFQVDVFIPQRLAEEFFLAQPVNKANGFQRALIVADAPEHAKKVEDTLREKRYTAYSVASVFESLESSLMVLTVAISFLTGIALLVAALGIVNTMVTSVLERTREIGLWKALGATNGQVQAAFLLEAALIGLIGGLAGLALAVVGMIPGEHFAGRLIQAEVSIPISSDVFVTPVWLLVAGPSLAMAVAVLAAVYPAWRAARIDPVQALRHD